MVAKNCFDGWLVGGWRPTSIGTNKSPTRNHIQKKMFFQTVSFSRRKWQCKLQKPRVDLVNIKMLHLDELFRDVLFFGLVIFISGIRRTVSRFFWNWNHFAALAGGSFLRLQRPLSAFRPCPTRRKIPYRQKEILIHANWNLQAVELVAECIARPILETFLDFTHLFYWANYPVIFEKSHDFSKVPKSEKQILAKMSKPP